MLAAPEIKRNMEQPYAEHFENLMYRLVLHGVSHNEERVKSMVSADFLKLEIFSSMNSIADDLKILPLLRWFMVELRASLFLFVFFWLSTRMCYLSSTFP